MEKYKIIEKENGIKLISYFNQHFYEIPGLPEPLPSVTKILGVIHKGYGYDQWLKDTGENADYITRRASESGVKLHNAFERAVKGETVECQTEFENFDEKEWQKFLNWVNWYTNLNIKPLLLEVTVFSEADGVAGTADLIAEVELNGQKEVILFDYKTGNNIYETSHLQVSAYFKYYNDLVDSGYFSTPKATMCGILHIGANIRTAKELNNVGVKFEETDSESDYISYGYALQLFRRFNPNLKAPIKDYPAEVKLTKGVLK